MCSLSSGFAHTPRASRSGSISLSFSVDRGPQAARAGAREPRRQRDQVQSEGWRGADRGRRARAASHHRRGYGCGHTVGCSEQVFHRFFRADKARSLAGRHRFGAGDREAPHAAPRRRSFGRVGVVAARPSRWSSLPSGRPIPAIRAWRWGPSRGRVQAGRSGPGRRGGGFPVHDRDVADDDGLEEPRLLVRTWQIRSTTSRPTTSPKQLWRPFR